MLRGSGSVVTMPRMATPARRWLVGGILLALIVVGGALRLEAGSSPGHRLFADERSYGRLAVGINQRGDYGDPRVGDRTRWAPGAPVAFALGDRLLPSGQARQRWEVPAARTVQAIVSTLLIVGAFGLAALLAGPAAGLVAAALIAGYPSLVTVTAYQISEPLAALLVLLGLLAIATGRRGHPVAWAAAAGVLLGLAVLTRADLLGPVLLAGPALWWALRRSGGVRQGSVLTAAVLVVIVPWCVFASVNRGRLVPVSGGGPGTLFMGTYLPGDGSIVGVKRALAGEVRARYPDLRKVPTLKLPARRLLDAVAARRPGETRDAALMSAALDNVRRYALGDPIDYAGMTLGKVERLWSRPFLTTAPGLIAIHLVLLAVGLTGLALGLLRREPVAVVLAVIALGSTLDNAILVSEPRHNMPLMPALVAVGVAGLAIRLRSAAHATERVATVAPA